eukprot:gene4972-8566_t
MKKYKVLYTKQKTKKVKSWIDGFMDYNEELKTATLLTEEKKFIDKMSLKPNINPDIDEEFDFGVYLIQMDEKITSDESKPEENNQEKSKPRNVPPRRVFKKAGSFKVPFKKPQTVETPEEVVVQITPTEKIIPKGSIQKKLQKPISLPLKQKKPSPKKTSISFDDDEDFSIADLDEENFELPQSQKKMNDLFFELDEISEQSKDILTPSNEDHFEFQEENIENQTQLKMSPERFSAIIPVKKSSPIIPVKKSPVNNSLSKSFESDTDEEDFFSKFDSKRDDVPPECITKQNTFKSPRPIPFQKPKVIKCIIDDDDDDEIPGNFSKVIQDDDTNDVVPNKKITKVVSRNFKPPTNLMQKFSNQVPSVLEIVKIATSDAHSLFFPDTDCWNLFLQKGAHASRVVFIPNQFKNVAEYRTTYLDGIFELMNVVMFEMAFKFREKYVKLTQGELSLDTPNCPHGHGNCSVHQVKKKTINFGRSFYSCKKKECKYFVWKDEYKKPLNSTSNSNKKKKFITLDTHKIQAALRAIGIPFYHSCDFFKSNPDKKKSSPSNEKDGYFLKLNDKEKGTPYSKDDIWIISSSDSFDAKDGFVMICKSLYHSPTNNSVIQLKPLFSKSPTDSCKDCFAIRGPNFSTEFEMIDCLKRLNGVDLPLLYEILGNPKIDRKEVSKKEYKKGEQLVIGKFGLCSKSQDYALPTLEIGLDDKEIFDMADEFIIKHRMNEDQQKVIKECAKWFTGDKKSHPITLIHGVFGAGKKVLDKAENKNVRILVSSVTNVAVDGILQGLLKLGYTDFLRVGSQRKIAKQILPFTVSSDKSAKETIKEYKEMLKEAMSKEDAKAIKQAISELESGVSEKKKDTLQQVRVVGVTCAASSFPILDESKFSIVILDESSQCLEPLALLPLSRFSCQKLIACGDPCQLPPTLPGNASDVNNSLEKTIFLRLANVGSNPIMLHTQYRCHPHISFLSNTLFYNNKLKNGVSKKERDSLIDGMPPLMIVDTNGRENFSQYSNSTFNDQEVSVVVKLTSLFLDSGIDAHDIGVIALYNTQSSKISTDFKTKQIKGIKVSTVDAFQGGEKEIIILSCVRTESLGFIESEKRLNVALTRARRHLIVVCKMDMLSTGKSYGVVIDHAKKLNNSIWSDKTILGAKDFTFIYQNKQDEEEIDFETFEEEYQQFAEIEEMMQEEEEMMKSLGSNQSSILEDDEEYIFENEIDTPKRKIEHQQSSPSKKTKLEF